MKKENKGITLVALVITIIVLLILAGVSINAIQNGGIIGNAQDAKNKYEEEKRKEESVISQLEMDEVQIDFLSKGVPYSFKNEFLTGVSIVNFKAETVGEFRKKLPEGCGYEIYDSEGNQITDETKTVCPGMVIKKDGEEIGTVIIYGDLNKDGEINGFDGGIITNNLLLSESKTDDYQKIAADVNHDGKVNLEDETFLSKYLRRKEEIIQNVSAFRVSELQIKYNDKLIEEYIARLAKNSNKYSIVLNAETNDYCLTGVTSETQAENISAVLNKLPGVSKIWRYNEVTDEDETVTSGPLAVDDYIIVTDEDNGEFLIILVTF